MLKHFLTRNTDKLRRRVALDRVHRVCSQSREFWWKDDDDKKDQKPKEQLLERKKLTSSKKKVGNNEQESNNSNKKRTRTPLHVMSDEDMKSDNVIDINSTSSSAQSSSSSSNDDDQSSPNNNNAPAILGEGENAPHVPSVMIMPRRGTPIFPVPEVAQHLLIKSPAVVNKLEKQLATGIPYIGVFLRKEELTVDTSQPESDANTFDVDDVIHDLSEIHSVGTLAQVVAIRQLPNFNSLEEDKDQTWHVMLTGHRRIRFDRSPDTILDEGTPMVINVEHLSTPEYDDDDSILNATCQEIMNTIRDVLKTNEILHGPVQDFLRRRLEVADPPRLADFAASLTSAKPKDLQNVMNTLNVQDRLDLSLVLLKTEVERSNLRKQIKESVEKKIGESQRKYMLQEQLKEIKNELGLQKDDKETLMNKFHARLKDLIVPKETQTVIDEEMSKLESLEKNSPEFNTTRNYMDWLTSIPWGKQSEENFDIGKAKNILDEDHYGMKDVKDRILEIIAVGKLKGNIGQGKIICKFLIIFHFWRTTY
jgi:ATP-dependent Lon protease